MARKLHSWEEQEVNDTPSDCNNLTSAISFDDAQLLHSMARKRDTELELSPELHAFWEFPPLFSHR